MPLEEVSYSLLRTAFRVKFLLKRLYFFIVSFSFFFKLSFPFFLDLMKESYFRFQALL
jgi:hypothetical protein